MIKAIIFDMDGVLIDADKWHFNSLNVALQHSDIEPISWQEHLTIYKGIPTAKKLQILTERRGLKLEDWERIKISKQDMTHEIINRFCVPDPEKIEMMRLLKRNFRIAVCSNSIRKTVELMLGKANLMGYVDFFLSNEDVTQPKPNPEIYTTAFNRLGLNPEECLVVEDSDVGKRAAVLSGAFLCSVDDPSEVNYYKVKSAADEAQTINVVVPAAGQGKRFSEIGYVHPKPLIDVQGKPMIQLVLENFSSVGRSIVLFQRKVIQRYNADKIVKGISPSATVLGVDGLTEGAACTILLAKEHINSQSELIIANSDQLVDMDLNSFVNRMRALNADGGILTFKNDHPKWSYAKADSWGRVSEVAEKKVISDQATVGIYYYRRGADFVAAAEAMIAKNIRVNNEFYVCPAFNEMIAAGKNIFVHEIDPKTMWGLGTPEDLTVYLNSRDNVASKDEPRAA